MKRIFAFSLALLFALAGILQAQSKFNYTEQWKTIDKLMDGILPQSALPEIDKAYQAALKDKAYGQLIKAVMMRTICLQQTGEKPLEAIINSLEKDAASTPFPAKAVIYSLTGEAYMNYYNQNRWKIYKRTALTDGTESSGIETWEASRLIREAIRYYQLSLTDPVLLQKINIAEFGEALKGDANTRYLRPTLYDFLAHRAIDAYTNNDLWIADFSQARVMDDPGYFADARNFINLAIVKTDTLAPAYLSLKLFQELTAFRLTQKDINPLADVNLKRYTWLKNRGNFDDADVLYVDAMKHLMDICAGQKIWGKVACTLALHYKDGGAEWSPKNAGQRSRHTADAVNLCREIEKYALLKEDRKLAADMVKELTQPAVGILIEKNIIPHKPALVMVNYRNLHTAYLNIYRYRPDDLEELYQSQDLREDVPRFLLKQEKIASQTIVLPVQKDYRQHSFETKTDTLPAGQYLLVVSDKPDPVRNKPNALTYHPVQVTHIKLLQRSPANNLEACVTDAQSGKPLLGAQVELIRRVYDPEQSKHTFVPEQTLSTDSCGITIFPKTENYGNGKIRITYGDETIEERMMLAYHNPGGRQKPLLHTAFFTDRAIYRPGQTLYFKGLLYETDNDGNNTIRPGTKTSVQLLDVNGKEVIRQDFTTGEFGSFNGSFTLPQGLLNGMMTIKNEYASAGISVEEYKRPTFEITMNPIAANHVLGDTVVMTGTAKALSGYAVDDARLEFNVMRYQEYRTFKRMIYPPGGSNRHVATGTLQTDEKGHFTIKFPAKADDIKKDDNSIYRYQMTVNVTDINGETQSSKQEIKLSRTPLLVDCRIPEKIIADDDRDSLKYALKTTNLNGNTVTADVEVEIWALKNPGRLLRDRLWQQPDTFVMTHDEFSALFPNDPYASEGQPSTYEKESKVATLHANTQKDTKIDFGILQDAPPGWYFMKLKASGGQNAVVADSVCVQLQRTDAPIMDMKEWLTAVKTGGEPGETAIFRIAGGNDSSLVRYEVFLKDKLIERKWLTVSRTPQELRFPITEAERGGFAVSFVLVQDNREYSSLQEIAVPYTNRELDIAFTSFRGQLLPGEKEKWTLTVKNRKGGYEVAEMVATLYDASLDMFARPDWKKYFNQSRSHYQYGYHRVNLLSGSRDLIMQNYFYPGNYSSEYEQLNHEYWGYYGNIQVRSMKAGADLEDRTYIVGNAANAAITEEVVPITRQGEAPSFFVRRVSDTNSLMPEKSEDVPAASIPLRTNFSETAFFYPELRTNEKGEVLVEFTIPEALTRWNMLGFAHTKDFKTGNINNNLITQKQVAISANLPRFFRTGDTLVLSAKVNNLMEKDLGGKALLRLYDAFTMQPVDARMLKTDGTQPFTVKAGQSAAVQWKLVVPATLQAVTYRLTAQAGNHTDGEERSVPILTDRMLITETMPFMVRGDQRKDFRFDRLAGNASGTLTHHRLTLEYTSNPAWYAVQALPYLMDYPYECAEQVFSRFYANSLATTVANSSPEIRQVFEQWRSLPNGKALISNLEKNQELKQALLEETPWVTQAGNETERKKRIGLLFDLNRMASEQQKALDKLKSMQGANGGFPWFAGQPEDRFVTQHIVAGLEHLRNLDALPRTEDTGSMIERAMEYCDARIFEDYQKTLKRAEERTAYSGRRERERRQIDKMQLHYLYTCSFSKYYPPDHIQAFEFYLQQAEKYWTRFNIYEQAMTALVMHRFGKPNVAQNILRSLKERAQTSDDMGMYWTDNRQGYFWNESPVETQAMLIEAFNEAGSDTRAVGEMKIWLLRNKQTTNWKTTKATTETVYALLSTEDDLTDDVNEPLDIRINGKPLKRMVKEPLRPEAGTGYVNTSWNGNDVGKSLASLRVTNPNSEIMWGAMYWQYFEDMDRITAADTNLRLNKKFFIKRTAGKGKILTPLTSNIHPKVGDVLTVRLELRTDRDFEYVHLKDMRAAGFEPVSTLSGYRFQDGLGYYESIKDASANFFISYLRKGTHVFEYDLRVTHAGDFSNGIATVQCMYAPEFNTHSEGGRVKSER